MIPGSSKLQKTTIRPAPCDKPGGRVWKTADWLACGGVVYFVHADPEQIASDIATFRAWGRRGALYELAAPEAG